jgi:hypothetical protein
MPAWSDEKTEILKNNASKTIPKIFALLENAGFNRITAAITNKRTTLMRTKVIKEEDVGLRFSVEEDSTLKELSASYILSEIRTRMMKARFSDRSEMACRDRLLKFGMYAQTTLNARNDDEEAVLRAGVGKS